MNRTGHGSGQRRSTPKVKDGKVQRKNRQSPTRNAPLIRRIQPGAGFRHIVTKSDVTKFLDLLPDWDELSSGLEEIVLAAPIDDAEGWHRPGTVAICVWEAGTISYGTKSFVLAYAKLYDRLGIGYGWIGDPENPDGGYYLVQFTEDSIRAYQFLHVLLHELVAARPKLDRIDL